MEKAYTLARLAEFKKATRRKIELGGLVIKAGLDSENKDVILGAQLSAVEELKREPATRELYQLKGKRAFLKLDD